MRRSVELQGVASLHREATVTISGSFGRLLATATALVALVAAITSAPLAAGGLICTPGLTAATTTGTAGVRCAADENLDPPSDPLPPDDPLPPFPDKVAINYGQLTPGPSTPVNDGCDHAGGVAFVPSGEFMYVGGGIGTPGRVCGYRIDPTTRALTAIPGLPLATSVLPRTVVIEPAGRFLYVLGGASNVGEISAYAIDRMTGVLSPIGGAPFAAGNGVIDMVVDPSGRHVYVSQSTLSLGTFTDSVAVLAIDRGTGALSPIAGSPFSVAGAGTLAFTPDGGFLFTGSTILSVDASSGATTQRGVISGIFPGDLTVELTGRFLYVTDLSSKTVRGFRIASDGGLTPVGTPASFGPPDGFSPRGITVVRDLVYVANQRANLIYGYRIDETTGALTAAAGSPFSVESPYKLSSYSALPSTLTLDAGDSFAGVYRVWGGQPPYTWSVPPAHCRRGCR